MKNSNSNSYSKSKKLQGNGMISGAIGTINGLYTTNDLTAGQINDIIELAKKGKETNWKSYNSKLKNKVICLMFFNPSLRTRASFQSGIARLGGTAVPISSGAGSEAWKLEFKEGAVMDKDSAEHVKDAAKVLSQYFDAVCIRAFPEMKSWDEDKKDTVINSFKKHLEVPLINMESTLWHPCQALADAMTIAETFGGMQKLKGKKFVLSWANHPKQLPMAVPNSAALIAAQLGLDVTIACPEGYDIDNDVMKIIGQHCKANNARFDVVHSQASAFRQADVIYAKSWTPAKFVGKPELEMRERAKLHWTVDSKLMSLTRNAIFMHCLPVRRNVKATDDVLDSERSVIIQQAGNRMHAQNALLIRMFGK